MNHLQLIISNVRLNFKRTNKIFKLSYSIKQCENYGKIVSVSNSKVYDVINGWIKFWNIRIFSFNIFTWINALNFIYSMVFSSLTSWNCITTRIAWLEAIHIKRGKIYTAVVFSKSELLCSLQLIWANIKSYLRNVS